jgi:hypothetical protein
MSDSFWRLSHQSKMAGFGHAINPNNIGENAGREAGDKALEATQIAAEAGRDIATKYTD